MLFQDEESATSVVEGIINKLGIKKESPTFALDLVRQNDSLDPMVITARLKRVLCVPAETPLATRITVSHLDAVTLGTDIFVSLHLRYKLDEGQLEKLRALNRCVVAMESDIGNYSCPAITAKTELIQEAILTEWGEKGVGL